MRKRFLSALLALCMVLTLFPGTALASESTGTVELKRTGNYANWIDRVELPDYATAFYNVLVEAADNDGTNDYLIGDQYFNTTTPTTALSTLGNLPAGSFVRINEDMTNGSDTSHVELSGILVTTLPMVMSDSKTVDDTNVNYAMACIGAVWNAFDRDHPEVFWLNGTSSSYVYGTNNTWYLIATLSQVEDGESTSVRETGYDESAIKSGITTRDANINTILTAIDTDNAPYYQLQDLNKWLTGHNSYNSAVAEGNNDNAAKTAWKCISALAGSTSTNGPVCEGYARAFKVICDKLDIPCVLTDGTAKSSPEEEGSGGPHMWNYVQLDGKWYAVDVTWNDPTSNDPNYDGSGNEDYFVVYNNQVINNSTFISSHPISNTVGSNQGALAFTNGPEQGPDAATEAYVPPFKGTVSITKDGTSVTTAKAGDTLTATVTPSEGTYTYQWLANGTAITDATSKTYEVQLSDAGKNITVTVTDDNDAPLTSKAVAIDNAIPTINVAKESLTLALNGKHDLSDDVSLEGIADSTGVVFSYTSNNDNVTVDEDGVVTAVAVGTATITISATLTGYEIAPVTVTVTVQNLPAQEVSFTSETPSSATLDDADFTVTAESKQGGEISYSSSNEDVATVDAETGKVTIVGVGTTTISATAKEITVDGTEYAATTIDFELTVAKKKIEVTADRANPEETYTYDTGRWTYPEVNVTDKETDRRLNFNEYSLTLKEGSDGISAGKQVIVVSPATSGDYTFDPIEVTFNIEKAVLNLTPKDITITLWIDQKDLNNEVIDGTATIVDRDGKNITIKGTWSFEEGTELDTSEKGTYEDTVFVQFTPDKEYGDNFEETDAEEVTVNVTVKQISSEEAKKEITTAVNNFVNDLESAKDSASELLETLVKWFSAKFNSASKLNRADFKLVINGKEYTADDLERSDVTLYNGYEIQILPVSREAESFLRTVGIDLSEITAVVDSDNKEPVDDETYYISVIRGDNGDVIVGNRYAEEGERVTVSVYPDNGYELDELTVTSSRGRSITLRDLGDGKYSFTMPAARVTVEATFVKEAGSNTTDIAPVPGTNHTTQRPDDEVFTGLGTPGISGIVLNPAPMPFSDVRYTDWFCASVEYMWKHYLMSGVSDSSFAPNLTTSRAMIWTVLARMNNIRTDLNPGYNWYENGMLWAMGQSITDGTNPLADITREQLATMLWRNAGSPSSSADLSGFRDAASVSAYAQTAIRWAVSNGVMNGENGLLNPQGTATRAQVAAMVARYGDKVA